VPLNLNVSIAKIIAMYIGAVIGAGFASGQEIMQFFIAQGNNWWKEVLLVTALFCYLGATTLYLAVKLKTNNYQALVRSLFGVRLGRIIDVVSMLMLMGGLSVMLSGSGAVFNEHLHAPTWLGISLIILINCVIMLGGLQGVLLVNAVLVPIKIIAICLISLGIILSQSALIQAPAVMEAAQGTNRHWFLSGVLYVSYNMILVIAVLTTLGKSISAKKAIWGGVLGGLGLGFTAGIMCLAGMTLYPEILNYKVPTIYMAGTLSQGFKYPIGFLIWLAIVTTAIANAHGLASRIAGPGSKKYKLIGIGATLLAIPLAQVEFDRLVATVYPLFGYSGLLIIALLLVVPVLAKSRG